MRRRFAKGSPPSPLVATQRVAPRDLWRETTAGLFARPARTLLTVVGSVIGIAALVATFGLSRTTGNRIVGRFDALAATEVVITPRPAATNPHIPSLPWDGPARAARLDGVVAAGNLSILNVGDRLVGTSPIRDPQNPTNFKLAVAAASPELFRAVRAEVRTGTLFDAGHSQRRERVAVLGPNAADRLGIGRVDQLPALTIGDDAYLIVGVLDRVARQPELASAVIIPEGTAQAYYQLAAPGLVVAETAIGAASVIAQQLPIALRPDDPRTLRVGSPAEPRRVRDDVKNDLNLLLLVLGSVSLLAGAVGIANVTLVSVIERTGEIGLRRALGATSRNVLTQFLLESMAMGLLGGVVGASVGTIVVVAASAYNSWTPVLDPWLPFSAPLAGGVVGLLAGVYPASRAARLQPVEALRSGS